MNLTNAINSSIQLHKGNDFSQHHIILTPLIYFTLTRLPARSPGLGSVTDLFIGTVGRRRRLCLCRLSRLCRLSVLGRETGVRGAPGQAARVRRARGERRRGLGAALRVRVRRRGVREAGGHREQVVVREGVTAGLLWEGQTDKHVTNRQTDKHVSVPADRLTHKTQYREL